MDDNCSSEGFSVRISDFNLCPEWSEQRRFKEGILKLQEPNIKTNMTGEDGLLQIKN